ncbi:MAG TPA: ABC transporter substrate-binding protein [Xenococcaceae cyanobacterium]
MTNSKETYWLCRGTRQEPHPEEEVAAGEPCPICEREYSANTERNSSPPVGIILGGVASIAVIGGLVWFFLLRPPVSLPDPEPSPVITTPTPSPQPLNPNSRVDYNWQPERFTWGQRTLFPGTSSPNLNNGIEAFQQADYQQAIASFEKAIVANRNEPEPLILFNNAQARQQGNPLTLAVVVPATGNIDSAQEMLRGVAMAQNEFNNSGGINDRLLEIVIANDENDPEIAEQVAQQLAEDPSILGVIGHNSSSASAAGLEVYEASNLAMISPTSSSTSLQGDVFFRTTPSDAAAAEKLAQYVTQQLNITKVVIFYNPNSSYSESLKEAFESNFQGAIVNSIDLSVPNFSAKGDVVTSVYQEEAQAALLFPDTQTVEVAREIAIANTDIAPEQRLKLLGGDALYNPATLINGGKDVEGLVLAVPWSRQSATSQTFQKASSQQWGGSVNWRTAMSYDATQALINSFSSSNNSRSSVLESLRQVRLTPTETSGIEVQFTAQGERQGTPVLVEVARDVPERPSGTEFGFKLVF